MPSSIARGHPGNLSTGVSITSHSGGELVGLRFINTDSGADHNGFNLPDPGAVPLDHPSEHDTGKSEASSSPDKSSGRSALDGSRKNANDCSTSPG